ncbi:class I SAM-dependent methyltransferase [Streptomyces sp. DSM 44917]|uniref:Class I SAM-dependent methyltransferase n=1 Tax=Streptomyces boetiae TaxID=3075541 RepID=A0ABU2LCR5_9ACTN|nr:class I SAM-dependent methyltransferase [Streptomyces sp. DSM 44917]MDT0309377.1 class I SAM-dependent methyltransferase [Streptomyces sp. DSM 44917]
MSDTESAAAWDVYARAEKPRRQANKWGERTWFNWTQYADHGPGAEVLALGPGDSVLDLGCGAGGNAAHLAALGMKAVGVDLSQEQLRKARERWADVPGAEWHRADALAYLAETPAVFDAVYSVFGAAWFCAPASLLPAVHARIRPGGVLAMSQRPPREGCYGRQAAYIPRGADEDPAIVTRWDHEPEAWCSLLRDHGFREATATVLDAPRGGKRTVGTLLIRAIRGGSPR